MLTCNHCRKTFELDADMRAQGVCPHCRAEMDLNDSSKISETPTDELPTENRTTIARSTSVAEVGYLANVLDGRGIESHVEQHDSFSAVDGRWTALFQLQVASEHAMIAAEAIQERLAQDESEPDDILPDEMVPESELPRPDMDDRVDGPVFWRPLLLIIFAGAALVFIGQRMRGLRAPAPRPGRSNQTDLLRALKQIRQPFISQTSPDNRQRHRLWYNNDQRTWHLDNDVNGDGIYESGETYR